MTAEGKWNSPAGGSGYSVGCCEIRASLRRMECHLIARGSWSQLGMSVRTNLYQADKQENTDRQADILPDPDLIPQSHHSIVPLAARRGSERHCRVDQKSEHCYGGQPLSMLSRLFMLVEL